MIQKFRNKGYNFIEGIIGSRNYKKAVILTKSRTGSNLLISMLNSNPEIDFKNEVFQRIDEFSVPTIWNRTFSKRFKGIKMVGFKLFYYHPLESEDRSVFDRIKNDKSITIIHLTRKNKLRNYLSQIIAHNSGLWKQSKGTENAQSKNVNVDPIRAIKHFQEIEAWENAARENFKDHKMIEVDYESLTSQASETLSSIAEFLDFPIEDFNTRSNLKKQNPEKLDELILNYDKLKFELGEHGFSHYFD